MAGLTSSLLTGTVRHRRVRPKEHALRYDVWYALVDLDEAARLDRDVRGFAYGRRGLATLRDTDHLGPVDLPLREKLERFLAGQDVALPEGRVLLQTSLRVLGYVFNPVSWFYCYDADDRLALVVAEVNNTFGDTHCYVLDDLRWTSDRVVEATADKVFHVSPFLPIDDLRYTFRFSPPTPRYLDGQRIAVHMDVADDDGHLFGATTGHTAQPLTTRSLLRAVVRMPFVTVKTIVAIHWEALFIWRRKAAFHRRPEPPATGFDAIEQPLSEVSRVS